MSRCEQFTSHSSNYDACIQVWSESTGGFTDLEKTRFCFTVFVILWPLKYGQGHQFWSIVLFILILNRKRRSSSIDWLKGYSVAVLFMSIFCIFRANFVGVSDLKNKVKVTWSYFKVTGTSRLLQPNHLLLHITVVRFHRLVHFIECRQDDTPNMPEGSSSKTMFPLPFSLMDTISTSFPFNELLCRY